MATATLLPNGKQQFLDANGDPLAGGTVEFYIPSTTTPKTTWKDPGETTPNTNPVLLDAAGEAVIYGAGQYRQIVRDVFGNLIWDQLTQGAVASIVPTPTGGQAGDLLQANATGGFDLVTKNAIGLGGKVVLINLGGTWTLFDASGAQVNISSSVTDGLQEAINLACTPAGTVGYDLDVIGGDESTFGANVINCGSHQISFPPLQGKRVNMGAVTINFGSGIGGASGILFDSLEMVDFVLEGGQVVYAGTGVAVDFFPRNGTPGDNIVTVGIATVMIESISHIGVGSVGVRMKSTNGSINNNKFVFPEINGQYFANTVGLLLSGDPTNFIAFNIIECLDLHQQQTACAALGLATTDKITANQMTLFCSPGAACTNAILDLGTQNEITFSIHEGEGLAAIGLNMGASASDEIYMPLRNVATAPINDGSTLQNARGIRTTNSNANNKGWSTLPDKQILQYINNAGGSNAGVVTTFAKPFPTACRSCVVTPTNQNVAFSAVATSSGVTIFTASGTPNFNVMAIGS